MNTRSLTLIFVVLATASVGQSQFLNNHSSAGAECFENIKKRILTLKQFDPKTVRFEEVRDDTTNKQLNAIEVIFNHQIKGHKERCWGAFVVALIEPSKGGKSCLVKKIADIAIGDCREEP